MKAFNPSEQQIRPEHLGFAEALAFWLKLGFISFGGPAGQISIMHRELVEEKRWISENRFLHALNYCMVLPGPEAQQLATYIGWLLHGTWGGIVAGSLFVLPSFFIISALAYVYLVFGNLPVVVGLFYGIKPVVTAIVVFAAYRIGSRALKNGYLWILAGLAFVALVLGHMTFPAVVLSAALIGWVGSKFRPEIFEIQSSHEGKHKSFGPAYLDDHTPPPEHAKYRTDRMVIMIVMAVLLWTLPIAVLMIVSGTNGAFTNMGLFFTRAALLTFGGAYAVLPYVYQGGVSTYGWLSGTQMMDGLALGETTPGPLIMIVTFVGFLGGWNTLPLGQGSSLLSALSGAVVATYFTFLPSFVFILLGGPIIEATRNDLRLTAPLTAITAAIVGVILSLAVFFANHVFFPHGWSSMPDLFAIAVTLIAFITMYRYKIGLIKVIGAGAISGLLHHLVMHFFLPG